jgi:membrane protease YdiL (CAAX protease family)
LQVTVNKTYLLYASGFLAVALAIIVPAISWLSPLTFMVVFPLAATWIWKSDGLSLWDLGYRFGKGWFSKLTIGLMIGLVIPIFITAIQIPGGWIILTQKADSTRGFASYLLVLLLKMILIVAIEEFVFRGFFIQALSRKAGTRLAVVLSSLLWGFSHLSSMVSDGLTPGSMIIGVTTFLLWGITLSLCYLRAGKSLWLPYGLHLGINLSFSLAGWFFFTQPHAPQWWIGDPAWSPESGLIGIVVWLFFALVANWLTSYKRVRELTPS